MFPVNISLAKLLLSTPYNKRTYYDEFCDYILFIEKIKTYSTLISQGKFYLESK